MKIEHFRLTIETDNGTKKYWVKDLINKGKFWTCKIVNKEGDYNNHILIVSDNDIIDKQPINFKYYLKYGELKTRG